MGMGQHLARKRHRCPPTRGKPTPPSRDTARRRHEDGRRGVKGKRPPRLPITRRHRLNRTVIPGAIARGRGRSGRAVRLRKPPCRMPTPPSRPIPSPRALSDYLITFAQAADRTGLPAAAIRPIGLGGTALPFLLPVELRSHEVLGRPAPGFTRR